MRGAIGEQKWLTQYLAPVAWSVGQVRHKPDSKRAWVV